MLPVRGLHIEAHREFPCGNIACARKKSCWHKRLSINVSRQVKTVRIGRKLIGALILAGLSVPIVMTSLSLAQGGTPSGEEYIPRLGDIMSSVQARHVKLWYAGKAANWDLAAFEYRQLKAGLVEAARLYAGIPVSNVTTMAAPMQSVEDAISAKDVGRFSKTFSGLTEACNGCHVSMARPYIVIQVPTERQPLGNQLFSPQGKR